MANHDHLHLAKYIKSVHSLLRSSTSRLGAERAWKEHCENKNTLTTYSQCMQTLATTHWATNSLDDNLEAISRIKWARDFCYDYFCNKTYIKYSKRDEEVSKKLCITLNIEESFEHPLKLLDVGSCYNPFKVYNDFDVLAIDLCPANETVYECDILNVNLGSDNLIEDNKISRLMKNSFEIVTFCFVLEYIPSSDLRVQACKKAYDLLKLGGLLIIATPDSKHVGANSKLIKNWQYTLALIGFTRIKYEKFKHMHCMAFRKSLHQKVAQRWAEIHKLPHMEYAIHIPQDFTTVEESTGNSSINNDKVEVSIADYEELPFNDIE